MDTQIHEKDNRTKCQACGNSFAMTDTVRIFQGSGFHPECTRCVHCGKQLEEKDDVVLTPGLGFSHSRCHQLSSYKQTIEVDKIDWLNTCRHVMSLEIGQLTELLNQKQQMLKELDAAIIQEKVKRDEYRDFLEECAKNHVVKP